MLLLSDFCLIQADKCNLTLRPWDTRNSMKSFGPHCPRGTRWARGTRPGGNNISWYTLHAWRACYTRGPWKAIQTNSKSTWDTWIPI